MSGDIKRDQTKMTPPRLVLRAILLGAIVTGVGAIFPFALPNTTNYLLLPGILTVYAMTGGVHGYSSGVYLPSVPVWYALGGTIDLLLYSLAAFWVMKLIPRRSDKGSL
jgi:hypothetical protein